MRREDRPGDNKTEAAHSTRNRTKQVGVELIADEGDEWRTAVAALTEQEQAPYDDPETYADIHYPGAAL
jgi:hypothetical protein